MSTATTARPTDLVAIQTDHIPSSERKKLAKLFCDFLDVAGTSTDRATFYNTKEEQRKAVTKIHNDLFKVDRGIYGMSLLLPTTDYTRQLGLGRLLDNPYNGAAVLTPIEEAKLIIYLIKNMPPHRVFKLYGDFRRERINNARTRKLILRSILTSDKLEFWSTKYRKKLKQALEHAWGKRTTGILKSILGKRFGGSRQSLTTKEERILDREIHRYTNLSEAYQCVAFILGHEEHVDMPLLSAYRDAKRDLEKGKGLSIEVLMGIRSQFHTTSDKAEVIELTKGKMTEVQKINIQRSARKAGVEVTFDPMKSDPVKLYIYAFEEGLTPEIQRAMDKKARKAAERLPLEYEHVGILIDTSESMRGDKTQSMRPIAAALATRDMLVASANKSTVRMAGEGTANPRLMTPRGDTSLAEGLIEVLKEEPDAVFIFSDGYENAPAGRVDETVKAVRKIGNTTPIFQISPVLAAEASGVRPLSDSISTMPLAKPEAIGIALIKSTIQQDLDRGIQSLARATLPNIGLRLESSS